MNIHMRFPGGKPRALTFSYDYGVRQDKKLVEIFNRYGIKGTFNIIPGNYGKIEDKDSGKGRMSLEEMIGLYDGHEIANHSATHPFLEQLPVSKAAIEVLNGREFLERDFDGDLPYGMTAHSRTDGENVYVFLQNYSAKPLATSTKYNWISADDKKKISGDIELAPYETLILSRKV